MELKQITNITEIQELQGSQIVLTFLRVNGISIYVSALAYNEGTGVFTIIPRRADDSYMLKLLDKYKLQIRYADWLVYLKSLKSPSELFNRFVEIQPDEYLNGELGIVLVKRDRNQPVFKALDYTDTVEFNYEPKNQIIK